MREKWEIKGMIMANMIEPWVTVVLNRASIDMDELLSDDEVRLYKESLVDAILDHIDVTKEEIDVLIGDYWDVSHKYIWDIIRKHHFEWWAERGRYKVLGTGGNFEIGIEKGTPTYITIMQFDEPVRIPYLVEDIPHLIDTLEHTQEVIASEEHK